MNNNKLIIAAAGSGKTTRLVNEALKIKDEKVLITTYTQANEEEIKKKIVEINKCIPENVTVQTWFSFLLKHGVRPFQGVLFDCLFSKRIKGVALMNSQSAPFTQEKNTNHYFTEEFKIYTDKLSKFVCRCNEKTNGIVVDRISQIYPHIFIDEVQDLAGYDLDLLKLLFNCKSNILLVGDPRQGTYSTNNASKNKKFQKSKILHFFEDKSINIEKDDTTLTVNYRCAKPICELSNRLFPTMLPTTSGSNKSSDHDGVFFVKKQDVEKYLQQYQPLQLRYNKSAKVNENYCVMNFGESKGLSFERVLIYPTVAMLKWIKDNSSTLESTTRPKFYVAITRAKHSVGIVVDDKEKAIIEGITYFVG